MDILQILGLLVASDSEWRTKVADFCWHPLALLAIPVLAAGAAWFVVSTGGP